MQHPGKIRFLNLDKRVNPIPIKSKVGVDSFQHQTSTISSRMDEIEMYYNQYAKINNSRVHGKSGKNFKKDEIDYIYKLIFDTPIPKGDDGSKNRLIDRIVQFYTEEYVPRNRQSMASTGVGNVDSFINTSIPQPKPFNLLEPTPDEEEEDFY